MKSFARATDLTVGKPLSVLLLYATPMLASMFFQQAYNLADSWIAGTRIGSSALGAVGTCYPITVFFLAIASGLSMGTSIYCSQQYGAGNRAEVKDGIVTSLLCFVPFSLVLCVLGFLLQPAVLSWLAVPPEAMDDTIRYLTVYLAGLPFLFLYNIGNGFLNGLGNSGLPLLFLIASSLLNIVLDLVLVIFIPMGITGLALATLLSQAAAAFATLAGVRRLCLQLKSERRGRLSLPVLKAILHLGIPSVIQHAFMSTGQFFMQHVINSYGLIVMAGYSVSFRINGLVVNSLMALSNSLSGYIAQNKGAGRSERIRAGFRISLLLSYGFCIATVILLLTKGPAILSFFIGDDPNRAEIVEAGMGFIRIVVPFYLLVCIKTVSDGALRGLGAMVPFMAATIADVLIRIFCGAPFSALWGIRGVWWVWPFAWLIGTAISFFSYLVCIRKENRTQP